MAISKISWSTSKSLRLRYRVVPSSAEMLALCCVMGCFCGALCFSLPCVFKHLPCLTFTFLSPPMQLSSLFPLGRHRKRLHGSSRLDRSRRSSLHPGLRGHIGRHHSGHPQDPPSAALQAIRLPRLPRFRFRRQMPQRSRPTPRRTGVHQTDGQPAVPVRSRYDFSVTSLPYTVSNDTLKIG